VKVNKSYSGVAAESRQKQSQVVDAMERILGFLHLPEQESSSNLPQIKLKGSTALG